METCRHGDMETWRLGDMENGDEDMETWRHRHGDMETGRMESYRHGHEDIKRKTEVQAIFLNSFIVCSSCKQKLVVCPFADEEKNGLYGLNGLVHLCSYSTQYCL
jgi:hypothetical protein